MAHSVLPANQTAVQIPCCVCGSLIFPNAANQCGSCLAQDLDLSVQLQKGPGTADYATIHQCRQCRRYQQTAKNYIHAEPESPELLAICLKHIPALQDGTIRLLDASWVWTEPHSMRYKLRITAQTEVQNVTIQQRVLVELRCAFQMCGDCNREYTNRTWQAVLQVRQRNTTKGLRALEMAIAAADVKVRKHVIRLDSTNAGLDFYFLELRQAQHLCQFVTAQYPCRTKVTQKFVSEDVKNNTANIKHTVSCELVPLAKDDIIILANANHNQKRQHIPSPLAGRAALVTHVSAGLIQCVDAVTMEKVDLTAELYYRYEKSIHVIKVSTVRALVLDVEAVGTTASAPSSLAAAAAARHVRRKQQPPPPAAAEPAAESEPAEQQPPPPPPPQQEQHVLHEVQLLYDNDDTTVVTATTHVGQYLTAGDTVLAYDLRNSTAMIVEEWLQHSYQLPDVIVIKKTKPVHGSDDGDDELYAAFSARDEADAVDDTATTTASSTTTFGHKNKKKLSKMKERRQRKDNRRMRELEERAARMGFIDNGDGNNDDDHEDETADDGGSFTNEIADEVTRLERELVDKEQGE
jgi:nonsense-mediated mRNA decay protein 3